MSELPAPEGPQREEWRGEKEDEKTHEKEEKPRGMTEKWQQDPLNAIVWASILIVGGFVLILDNLGDVIVDQRTLGVTSLGV